MGETRMVFDALAMPGFVPGVLIGFALGWTALLAVIAVRWLAVFLGGAR